MCVSHLRPLPRFNGDKGVDLVTLLTAIENSSTTTRSRACTCTCADYADRRQRGLEPDNAAMMRDGGPDYTTTVGYLSGL